MLDFKKIDRATFWKLYSIAKWEAAYSVQCGAPAEAVADGGQQARGSADFDDEIGGVIGRRCAVAVVGAPRGNRPDRRGRVLYPLVDEPGPVGILLQDVRRRRLARNAARRAAIRRQDVDALRGRLRQEIQECAAMVRTGVAALRRSGRCCST